MKKEIQIFDQQQPQVLTDTGSDRVFIYLNEREVTVAESDAMGDGAQAVEKTKYEYDVIALTPATKSEADVRAALRSLVLQDIAQYDASPAVNEFTIGGEPMWLDDALRTKVAKRIQTDEADGLTETRLTHPLTGKTYALPIDTAKAMLHRLESYARDSFDRTNEHVAAVLALEPLADIANYDFTTGYPEKLQF